MEENNVIALCCITNYYLNNLDIEDFCEYYFNLGFTKIYLIDDAKYQKKLLSSIPYIREKINNKQIIYLPRYDHPNQHGLYDAFYLEHCKEFDWCAFFDSDEYLLLKKHNTIQEFLTDKELDFENKADTIHICWKNFNDNGYVRKPEGKIYEAFTEVAKNKKNKIETKVIVKGNLTNVKFFIGHYAISNKNLKRMLFCDGTPYNKEDAFHEINYEIAELRHYLTQSTEEYIRKKSIGRLDLLTRSYIDSLKDFKNVYFSICQKTKEKEELFDKAISILEKGETIPADFYSYIIAPDRSLNLYCTYYKDSQSSGINKDIKYLIPYNTNSDEFETNKLNVFWSEFIVMKNIWKKGKSSEYIGFEQYDTHFTYSNINNILENYSIYFYKNMKLASPSSQFATFHSKEDIENTISIIKELYGENSSYEKYLREGKVLYDKSCFIMSWELFDKMSQFIFSILDKLDEFYHFNFNYENYENFYKDRVSKGYYKTQMKTYEYQRRAFGFIGERLISAWIYCNIPPEEIYFEKDRIGANNNKVIIDTPKKEPIIKNPIIDSMIVGTKVNDKIRPISERNPKIHSRALRILINN